MVRRWQKFAAMQRKRISFSRNGSDADSCNTSSSSIIEKGHFVVYTADQARFVIPLAYLENEVIKQLLNMSEEEFGHPSGGPITLPCDSAFMDYIISLKEQLLEIFTKHCSSQLHHVAVRLLLCTKKVEIIRFLRWQKFVAKQRKRISLPRIGTDGESCSVSSSIVEKGHFVVYTVDQARFVIPLVYLENEIIRQLLNMSKEEFGLPSGGSIMLPCDSVFVDYFIALIKKDVAVGDLHKALLLSIPSVCCSTSSLHQESGTQQILIY
ncbi:hypothetical protein HAX54_015472 [Datura stramonium]|uniref:Uncharacterized protein n=1 Tax=Datura stramonium TaxID=4076 RepID=A0ABS8RZM6_DATST|nr:hypothetical protein [Datura stramonium]